MCISDWSSDVCSSDLIMLPDRGRRSFDDIDDKLVGEPPRYPRILNPPIFHQVGTHAFQIDRRHRAVLLRERDVIDLEPVDPLGPDDLDFLHLKASTGDGLRPFLVDFRRDARSEEHTSELQSLMRISYAVFCLKKKKTN